MSKLEYFRQGDFLLILFELAFTKFSLGYEERGTELKIKAGIRENIRSNFGLGSWKKKMGELSWENYLLRYVVFLIYFDLRFI